MAWAIEALKSIEKDVQAFHLDTIEDLPGSLPFTSIRQKRTSPKLIPPSIQGYTNPLTRRYNVRASRINVGVQMLENLTVDTKVQDGKNA